MEGITEVNINAICKEAKTAKKWSNAKISEESTVPTPTVNSFFGPNAKSPSFDTTWKICKSLGVSMDDACGIPRPDIPAEVKQTIEDLKKQIAEKDARLEFAKHQEVYLETSLRDSTKEIQRKDDHIKMLESVLDSSYQNSEMIRSSFHVAEDHTKALQNNIEIQKEYAKKLERFNMIQWYAIIFLFILFLIAVIGSGWFIKLWEIFMQYT